MEPKKNPEFDIHRKRGLIFNFSLAISMLLVFSAFKWSVEMPGKKNIVNSDKIASVEMPLLPIVYEKKKELPAPQAMKTPKVKPSLDAINLRAVSDNKSVEEPPQGFIDQDISSMVEISVTAVEAPEEKAVDVWTFVEKMPEPVGGWQTFFKTLIKNMKYPRQASRINISGRVFVGFVINENGVPQDLSIIKGIGYGCDEEAMRVIALTKWNPGKQRGRPVKVRMVQPVNFSLGTP
jgi:protein TonB